MQTDQLLCEARSAAGTPHARRQLQEAFLPDLAASCGYMWVAFAAAQQHGSSCGGMTHGVAFCERHAPRDQVLHVAVLRRRHDLAGALLEAGFPVALANARKWAPVDEAIALNDKRMVRPRHSLCDCPGRRSSTSYWLKCCNVCCVAVARSMGVSERSCQTRSLACARQGYIYSQCHYEMC